MKRGPNDNEMHLTGHAMGQRITGSVEIEPGQVHVTIILPLLLAMFASKLKPRIEAEGRSCLEDSLLPPQTHGSQNQEFRAR